MNNSTIEALRAHELAHCARPRNELERIAQIVLAVIHHHDEIETIDWQIAAAVLVALDLRPEDGSIAAMRDRADGNADSVRQLMRVMSLIADKTSEPEICQLAIDAIRMSWLTEEGTPL